MASSTGLWGIDVAADGEGEIVVVGDGGVQTRHWDPESTICSTNADSSRRCDESESSRIFACRWALIADALRRLYPPSGGDQDRSRCGDGSRTGGADSETGISKYEAVEIGGNGFEIFCSENLCARSEIACECRREEGAGSYADVGVESGDTWRT